MDHSHEAARQCKPYDDFIHSLTERYRVREIRGAGVRREKRELECLCVCETEREKEREIEREIKKDRDRQKLTGRVRVKERLNHSFKKMDCSDTNYLINHWSAEQSKRFKRSVLMSQVVNQAR